MLRQRGFIQLTLFGWVVVAAAIAFAGLTAAVTIQTKRLASCKQDFAAFEGGVRALGEKAKAEAIATAKRDLLRKEKADAENSSTTAALAARVKRMRDELDARGSTLPPAPAASKCPDGQACFDRAELERANRERREAVRRIADEGSQIELDLNTARKWAQERK